MNHTSEKSVEYGNEKSWRNERINLTSDEYVYYLNLFNLNDKFDNKYIDNKTASSFLQNSGLSISTLHTIWELSDVENKGYLTLEDFFVSCRLVAHAQNGYILTSNLITIQPTCLPSFDIVRHKSFSDVSNIDVQVDWRIKEEERKEFLKIFKSLDVRNTGEIEGSIIREYYLDTSNLSICELMQIWNIADIDNDGNLNFKEFCIMNKIVETRKEIDVTIPLSVPKELIDSLEESNNDNSTAKDSFNLKDPSRITHLKEEEEEEEEELQKLKDQFPLSFGDLVKSESEKKNERKREDENGNKDFDFFDFNCEKSDPEENLIQNNNTSKRNQAKQKKELLKEEEEEDEEDIFLKKNYESFDHFEDIDKEDPFIGDSSQDEQKYLGKDFIRNDKISKREKENKKEHKKGKKEKDKKKKSREQKHKDDSDPSEKDLENLLKKEINEKKLKRKDNERKKKESESKEGHLKKIIDFNYYDLKDYNLNNKDIYKIEEINRQLEEEIDKKKKDIERKKKQKSCLNFIFKKELERYQYLKEERRNLEFVDLCLYKDIKYTKESITYLKQEIKEIMEDINKINTTNIKLNKNHMLKEKELHITDLKRKQVTEIINKEKNNLKKDERNMILLNNMIEYLKKQKNRALQVKDHLKNRLDITNADHEMLIKNVMHQQNHLNEIMNRRLNIQKLKNQKLVLFNSLAYQSIFLNMNNGNPFFNGCNLSNGKINLNGNDNENQKQGNNKTYPLTMYTNRNSNECYSNLNKKYVTDGKGIPNHLNEETKNKKDHFLFEQMKNGDHVDVFSSLDDIESNKEDVPFIEDTDKFMKGNSNSNSLHTVHTTN